MLVLMDVGAGASLCARSRGLGLKVSPVEEGPCVDALDGGRDGSGLLSSFDSWVWGEVRGKGKCAG